MSREPTYGVVGGQEVHAHTRHYQGRLLTPREALRGVAGFNAKLAVLITSSVGTMACAYLFALLALVSLPAILIQAGVLGKQDAPRFLTQPGLILVVAWIAQTFIQLVLLSIILVGQRVQATASDGRAAKQFKDTEYIVRQVDETTAGGLRTVLDRLDELHTAVTRNGQAEPYREPPHTG